MVLRQIFKIVLLTGSIWLYVATKAIANQIFSQLKQDKSAIATKVLGNSRTIKQIREHSTNARMLVQSPPTNSKPPTFVPITGVKANPTPKGVEVILETPQGDQLQVTNRSIGNNFIADVSGGQLRLPSGEAFTFHSAKPLVGITEITVTNVDANTVRVTVVGEKALPTVELFDDNAGLVFTVALQATATSPQQPPQVQQPQSEAQPTQPSAEGDEPIELVVTGEQDGYRVLDASTATKTDTPLRDIPQSIQVVPQQVLQDRQTRSIIEGLENVSGVTAAFTPSGSRAAVTIRGFASPNFLVNGLIDTNISSDGNFANVERLEILKGPASVLYGQGGLGGTINLVTKQPLPDPFYQVSATAGNFDDYRGAIDFSGPLNDSKTALYRFNASYRSFGSFLDFEEGTAFSVSPNLAFKLGANTDLTLEGDLYVLERNGQQPEGQPAVGTVLPNPNGQIRRSFNAAGPQTDNLTLNYRAGYRFEHRFSDKWKLRNAFTASFYDDDDRNGAPIIFNNSLAIDNRTLTRRFVIASQYYRDYYLDTNLLGQFRTGAVEHQLLFGLSLNRKTSELINEFGDAAPVDIFNPVFNQTVTRTGRLTTNSFTTRDLLGFYIQDQIKLAENLKILLGGRFDTFEERLENGLTSRETRQSDTALSPRVGIVYQPVPAISLYASFARSFNPAIGASVNGNSFRPERGTQYEVGIKADLNSRLSTTLAFYDLTRSNVLTTDINNPLFFVQIGEQNSRGLELDISGEIFPGWNIIAGYAYNDATISKDNPILVGNRLNNAPQHSFNLWTAYRIQTGSWKGLGLGLGFYYVGERQGDLANTFELPSYLRTDAAIFYERDRFRASLNFRNLFDVD